MRNLILALLVSATACAADESATCEQAREHLAMCFPADTPQLDQCGEEQATEIVSRSCEDLAAGKADGFWCDWLGLFCGETGPSIVEECQLDQPDYDPYIGPGQAECAARRYGDWDVCIQVELTGDDDYHVCCARFPADASPEEYDNVAQVNLSATDGDYLGSEFSQACWEMRDTLEKRFRR